MLELYKQDKGVVMAHKRSILIFPKFDNENIIQEIRDKYDPLVKQIKPHITLVFPFESTLKTETLKEHLTTVLKHIGPFELNLKGIEPVSNYLFLKVVKGQERIIEIHQKLYSGILKDFFPEWLGGQNFYPHLTVGKITDPITLEKAIEDTNSCETLFSTVVTKISVEIIADNDDSIVEFHILLKRRLSSK